MIKSIDAPKLAEILPQSIRADEKIHAAAVAIDAELEKISALANLTMHLPRLDELPSEVLDHLAFQFHCDFYLQSLPISAKRDQIRESIFWHRIKGTPGGVEKAISTFIVGAQVQENWQYDGEPYFFRIVCKGLKYLSTEKEFLRLIDLSKNVRSWLDGIIFDLTIEEPEIYHHAIAEVEGGKEDTLINLSDLQHTDKLNHAIAELEGGFEETGWGGVEFSHSKYYFATAELEGGYEEIDAVEKPPPDDFWLERYLLEQWKNFIINPAVHQYEHPDEGEISPFDPDFFPTDANYLKLYFQFPNNRYKWLTLYNPREDLTPGEIKAIGLLGKGLLKNSAGYTSTGLTKAFFVTKKSYKIF